MRRIRYVVAMSLDGYIAGPNGEVDWIIMDPDIDFGALFGGGSLFRSLLEARQVDAVEVSVIPVLLGEGISLLPPNPSSERFKLKLTSSRTFKTGIVSLEYAVEYEPVCGRAARNGQGPVAGWS
jgi:dihydrofolate reductase